MRRVEVRSAAPIDADELLPLIELRPGEPLDEDAVRRTLRNLRLSGLAAEAEVRRRVTAEGLDVVVALWPELRVRAVRMTGDSPLKPDRLLALAPQRAGEPLREDRVVRGVYRLREALVAEGYLGARVRVSVSEPAGDRTVEVSYQLEPGARSRVGTVEVAGLGAAATVAEALAAMRLQPGEPYRPRQLADDAERLQRFLYARGFGTAEVEPPGDVPAGERVDLRWQVRPGPRIVLTVDGAEQRDLAKRDLLPFLGDAGYDEALLLQSLAQIRRHYQERGHYRVEVTHEESRDAETLRLRLVVRPGPRYELAAVDFAGELSYDSERLERMVATARRRLLAPGSGRLVDETLAEDLSNLRSFYALEGYYRARIGPPRVDESGDELRVTVPIEEGPRRVVEAVAVEGLTQVAAEDALRGAALAAGAGFHPFHVDAAVERLLTLLDGRGFRSALVAPEVTWVAPERATVTLRVLEGEPSRVATVIVRGNARTDTALVRRFLGLEPGAAISDAGLLEAQRALYGLGAFSSVRVHAPVDDGEFVARKVVVEVEEGKTRSLVLGVGWDSEDGPRGVFRAATLNLAGTLASLQLDALLSGNEQDLRLLYRQPYLFRWRIESRALAFYELEERTAFEVRRRGVGLGLSRPFGRSQIGLYASYRLVDEEVFDASEELAREDREARVASLTASALYDRRDDPVDPTRGWSAYLEAENAEPLLEADADFGKLFGQLSWIRPLGRRQTAALSVRGGRIFPRGAAPAGGATIDNVPVSELFYGGGRTSHRAYRRDELGVFGQTIVLDDDGDPLPLGGGALGLINLDWRFPLFGELGGVVFVDSGNVWRTAADVDLSELRLGAGVGLRYRLPFGPLRLEIGWKLDREPFEDPYVVSVTLGNAF
ncbi:MAG: BamA/TamA family outer membrane protein [Thermoanaerobaculia bacterium]|nr:BamA/TamA family outer membrane protein [Thermoanaerobaculia bacterium]